MEWHLIKEAGRKKVGAGDYDLTHLQDSTTEFTIAATPGYAEINASMLIQYSSHCISTGPAHGEHFDFAALGHDRLVIDERGNERCFSVERFHWSRSLPAIIRSLPTDRLCFFTGHENWLSIEILDPQGVQQVYEVFFNLTRQSSRFLRVYVESAYVRTEENEIRRPSDFQRKAKIRGKVLVAKKLRKEAIMWPRQR
jgi:hypothetical protein